MSKSLPPLNWFRSFEAAARTLSSTAAAHEIGLTQSAVSQQIRALEDRLGVRLFTRHARGLTLTDEGRKLLPQVETALDGLRVATAPYAHARNSAHITVAASLSIIEWVISPGLPDFHAHHPDVTIRFVSTIWPDEFAVARADVEIRFGSDKQVGKGAQALGPDRLIAVARDSGPLGTMPLIETVGTSHGWAAWHQTTGQTAPQPAYFVDSYGLALNLAANGSGAALVSSVVAGSALATGKVQQVHKTSIDAAEKYFLALQRSSDATQSFANWLSARIAAADA
ncbi:LysR family transcriptional regulator [uncultured Tateyamaria sp.]|uniref:LysR family transcriptional regulator n=1 Tax=uncultured Tateyamaria sp. TaxID=455651 RepID=UPI002632B32B|nr:LysR family transcriptional regulator [uncultured Tateyamaria sp.]